MAPEGTSYREAGVDVEAGDRVKARMGPAIRSTFGPRVLTDVGPLGSFGGMFSLAGWTCPSRSWSARPTGSAPS